jgi:cytochrome c5
VTVKIDHNVPMPDEARRGWRTRKYPWQDLAVGDSFVFPHNLAQARALAHNISRRLSPRRFRAARTADGVIHIWRVPDEAMPPKRPHEHHRQTFDTPRNVEIVKQYLDGTSSVTLAESFGVSRERICQILRKANAIAHKEERARLAREMLTEEHARLKAEAKQALTRKLAQGIELVQQGASQAQAASAVGLIGNERAVFGKTCKQLRIQSQHGRWRDWAPRIARLRGLRQVQKKPWKAIFATMRAEGYGGVNATWVHAHLPELVRRRRSTPDDPIM